MIICDLPGNHKDTRRVAFTDGHVEVMSEEEFQAGLKKPENAKFAEALKKAEQP